MEAIITLDEGSSGVDEEKHENNGVMLCAILAVSIVFACSVTQSYTKGECCLAWSCAVQLAVEAVVKVCQTYLAQNMVMHCNCSSKKNYLLVLCSRQLHLSFEGWICG